MPSVSAFCQEGSALSMAAATSHGCLLVVCNVTSAARDVNIYICVIFTIIQMATCGYGHPVGSTGLAHGLSSLAAC